MQAFKMIGRFLKIPNRFFPLSCICCAADLFAEIILRLDLLFAYYIGQIRHVIVIDR